MYGGCIEMYGGCVKMYGGFTIIIYSECGS